MDRAKHLHVAGLLEGDVGRGTRRLRAEIELVALAGRKDVVRDGVVVDEGQRLALLDRDVLGGEHPALLMDFLIGRGERARGEAGENGKGNGDQVAHFEKSISWRWSNLARQDRDGGRTEIAVQRLHEGD